MIGIFDIDSIVYEAVYSADDFEGVVERFWDRYNSIRYNVGLKYPKAEIILCGFCTKNYRKKIYPLYKANRPKEKPAFLQEIIEYVKKELPITTASLMETDDLVAKYLEYYGKDNSFIISIDKDYRQFECTIYNYRRDEWEQISKDEATFNLNEQMIIGDTADNVNFCKGFGKAWVKKNLVGKNEYAQRRAVYSVFKKLYKSKAKEMYVKSYMLLKLNLF